MGPPTGGIAITPDGKTAYVITTVTGAQVTPINIATNMAGRSIALRGQAGAIAVSASGHIVYVMQQTSSANPATITVSPINETRRAALPPITIHITDSNSGFLTVTPNGQTMYLASYNYSSYLGKVLPVNTATGKADPPISVTSGSPTAMVITPVGVSLTRPIGTLPHPGPVRSGTVPVLGVSGLRTEGCGTARPDLIYGGGDPSDMVRNIHWQSWGAPMAFGTGEALWVTTTVVAGKIEPVKLVAYRLGLLAGKYAYRSLDIYFPQHGQTFRRNTVNFIC